MATDTKHHVPVRKETQLAAPTRMMSPFEEVDRLFGRIMPRGWMRPMGWQWPSLSEFGEPFEMRMPRVDLVDDEDNVVIRAELPAVEKKDLDISVNDTSVTIKGKTVREEKIEKGDVLHAEIGYGEFTRTLSLPCAVDGSKATAQLKDGMLTLTLPKIEKSKRHTVKIE